MKAKQRDQILHDLKEIVTVTLKGIAVQVYLFGSWARGEEKRSSDIDIGIQCGGVIPDIKWIELRDKIDESSIPYKVDLVDLSQVNADFLAKVMREGILWTD